MTQRGRVVVLLASLAALASWLTAEPSARAAAALAAALLGAALVVDFLFKMHRPDLVLRPAPRQVEAKQAFLEAIEIENLGASTLLDLLVHEPMTMAPGSAAHVAALPGGASLLLTLPARARQRGCFERVVHVDLLWPLALVRKRLVARFDVSLIVEPARIDMPAHLRELLAMREGTPTSEPRPGDAEFWMLREYSYGEDLRHAHALRSASTGTLVRRICRGEEAPSVWIVLDLRRPQGRAAHGKNRFEWSMSATASLCDELTSRGVVFTCLVLDREPMPHTVGGEAERQAFLAFLAGARPVEHHPVDLNQWPELHEAQVCLWIPAGGARASTERSSLHDATLVSIDAER